MKFLGFKYFGILTKDPPMQNEAEMKYDGFFCFRFVGLIFTHTHRRLVNIRDFHCKIRFTHMQNKATIMLNSGIFVLQRRNHICCK